MIIITIKADDLDYGALAERLLPIAMDKADASDNKLMKILAGALAAGGSAFVGLIDALPQATKDELAAALINGGKEKIIDTIQKTAENHNVSVKIRDISAEIDNSME